LKVIAHQEAVAVFLTKKLKIVYCLYDYI